MFECCLCMYIMVMVDCLIDNYFWICVSLCSIALSSFCCICRIVHSSIDGGLFGSELSKVCIYVLKSLVFTLICIESCWYLSCVVLFLVLCCGPILLQMSRRSSKGKDIVADDPATPVAKRTRLSSQSSQDSNEERFWTPLTSHIYSNIFDKSTPIVERVVKFNSLGTTFIP